MENIYDMIRQMQLDSQHVYREANKATNYLSKPAIKLKTDLGLNLNLYLFKGVILLDEMGIPTFYMTWTFTSMKEMSNLK